MVAITITYSESVENSVEMETIGDKLPKGIEVEELVKAREAFEKDGFECELFDLKKGLDDGQKKEADEAKILVIRNAVDGLLKSDNLSKEDMLEEQKSYEWDKNVFSRKHKRVVNKLARYNVCYANFSQEPDIINKKGRVVNFSDVKCIEIIKNKLGYYLGKKASNLLAEGNKYYDVKKCGIGYHGDTERSVVIAIRLGEEIPLHYQWYKNGKCVGENMKFEIKNGDMYVMSSKAVGVDWKTRKIHTLRHAAGCKKYTTPKILTPTKTPQKTQKNPHKTPKK
jgi:hypothetical protein